MNEFWITQQGANSKPDFDYTNMGLIFPANDNTHIAYFICQLPHLYKEGTPIYPHVHWAQTSTFAATFLMDYRVTFSRSKVTADSPLEVPFGRHTFP